MFLHVSVILFTGGLPLEGVCMERADPLPRYGQLAVGTHPTGMHTCTWKFSYCNFISVGCVSPTFVVPGGGGVWSPL